jgi:hypothetical protein
MSQDTIKDRAIYEAFANSGALPLRGKAVVTVTRHDGSTEVHESENIGIAAGIDKLAGRAVANTNSPFAFLAIGTVTAQASLGSTNLGEVDRKSAATSTSSKETIILISTWAGDADSITSVAFGTGGIVNHANSGSGEFLNMVNSLDTVLADSDFLKVQVEVQVGSHNL